MKFWLGYIMSTSSALIILLSFNIAATNIHVSDRAQSPPTEVAARTLCLANSDVSTSVEQLSTARNYAELNRAKSLLLDNAKRSPTCKKQIIAALMTAMDKPNLDLLRDQASFRLWFYGSDLLGDLQAVEALDLLISHSELNDGTSFPLNHHPALAAVIKIGRIAIPKLDAELRHNPDPKSRRYAIFCIAQIGGSLAVTTLKKAEPLESDLCNHEFIRKSITALANKRLPNQITSEDRPNWYSAFLCNI